MGYSLNETAEGKTDYQQRRHLVIQDKNKYQTPKKRFVVRFTNTQVICQIIYAEIDGDKTICHADSRELKRYGLNFGLKNYAAAYCTGLLLARRVLNKLGLAEKYPGVSEVDANIKSTTDITDSGKEKKFWVPEVDEEKRPLRAFLDVGIAPTTVGARLFGAVKGASDGGLDIPHNEKRFPGYDGETKEYNPEMHRERIFGQHIGQYMEKLGEENQEKLKSHFSQFLKNKVTSADDLQKVYEKVHAAIRKDPSPKAKKNATPDKKWKKKPKGNLKQRKNRVQQKIQWRVSKLQAAEDE